MKKILIAALCLLTLGTNAKNKYYFGSKGILASESERSKGYMGFIEPNLTTDFENLSFGATTIHGYQFNSYIFLGAGGGFYSGKQTRYNYNGYSSGSTGKNYISIPVFVDFRANFSNSDAAPFVEVRSGASFSELNNYLYESVGFGLDAALSKKTGIYFVAAYELYSGEVGSKKVYKHHAAFRLGFRF